TLGRCNARFDVFELPRIQGKIVMQGPRRFPRILDAIAVVRPETVVRWHRMGFAAYWRWKSRRRGGRPRIGKEVRDLIRRISGRQWANGTSVYWHPSPFCHPASLPRSSMAPRLRI